MRHGGQVGWFGLSDAAHGVAACQLGLIPGCVYMAASALAVTSATDSPGSARVAPMLSVAWKVLPARWMGAAVRARIFSAISVASSMLCRRGSGSADQAPQTRLLCRFGVAIRGRLERRGVHRGTQDCGVAPVDRQHSRQLGANREQSVSFAADLGLDADTARREFLRLPSLLPVVVTVVLLTGIGFSTLDVALYQRISASAASMLGLRIMCTYVGAAAVLLLLHAKLRPWVAEDFGGTVWNTAAAWCFGKCATCTTASSRPVDRGWIRRGEHDRDGSHAQWVRGQVLSPPATARGLWPRAAPLRTPPHQPLRGNDLRRQAVRNLQEAGRLNPTESRRSNGTQLRCRPQQRDHIGVALPHHEPRDSSFPGARPSGIERPEVHCGRYDCPKATPSPQPLKSRVLRRPREPAPSRSFPSTARRCSHVHRRTRAEAGTIRHQTFVHRSECLGDRDVVTSNGLVCREVSTCGACALVKGS